ncbi:MAG TPA: glycosyltransferase [Actinomycetota bacterium]|nr:glycosyltransferase [Actinomycetota bacterium]
MKVAIVQDHLVQRGGSERVVLSMLKAFPGAAVYTSIYDKDKTFSALKDANVISAGLEKKIVLRNNHRLAFPLMPRIFSKMKIDADIVLCSCSGWAHGIKTDASIISYYHTPAKWLYQREEYLGPGHPMTRAVLAACTPALKRWDQRAARRVDIALANSLSVQRRVAEIYGIRAEVLHPPPGLEPSGPSVRPAGVPEVFDLTVARLVPHKNVEILAGAFRLMPTRTLVVVGDGPLRAELESSRAENMVFVGSVSDEYLRWLYANCSMVLCPSWEDYGLTAVEAASFGKPTLALRWGGFLETIIEGVTGSFFDQPTGEDVARAVVESSSNTFDPSILRRHAASFSEESFIHRLREVVAERAIPSDV